jgi:hypothetical protein
MAGDPADKFVLGGEVLINDADLGVVNERLRIVEIQKNELVPGETRIVLNSRLKRLSDLLFKQGAAPSPSTQKQIAALQAATNPSSTAVAPASGGTTSTTSTAAAPADAKIRWTLYGDTSTGTIDTRAMCQITLDFTGKLVGWAATISPQATISFDLWRTSDSSDPDQTDSLGLTSSMSIVTGTAGGSSFATAIDVTTGDILRLFVGSNDVATRAVVDILAQITS